MAPNFHASAGDRLFSGVYPYMAPNKKGGTANDIFVYVSFRINSLDPCGFKIGILSDKNL
jgi:hypothetical protein